MLALALLAGAIGGGTSDDLVGLGTDHGIRNIDSGLADSVALRSQPQGAQTGRQPGAQGERAGSIRPLHAGGSAQSGAAQQPLPHGLPSLLSADPDAALICAAYTVWECAEALSVFRGPTPLCPTGESGGNWDAISPSGCCWGGFSVNYESHKEKLRRVTGSLDRELLLVPWVNVAVAHLVYAESGGGSWAPWACRPGIRLPSTGIGE